MGSLETMRAAALQTLVTLVLAALLAGCGSDDSTESTAATTTTPGTAGVSIPESSTTGTATLDEPDAPVAPDDSAGTPEEADDPGADRPRAVEDVVAAVLTGSEKPTTICDDLVTPAYVKTAYGDREGCIAAQEPGSLAKSVQVSDVKEAGDTATAVAKPTGGPYDGDDVEASLVAATDLDGAWVLDSLVADVPAGP
jgi:hypothetical protein